MATRSKGATKTKESQEARAPNTKKTSQKRTPRKSAKAPLRTPVPKEDQCMGTPSAATLYFQELRGQTLLTEEETVALGYKIRDGRLAQEQLEEYGEELDADTQAGLLSLCRTAENSVNYLVEHYLPFVAYIISRENYTQYDVPIEDLIQEGNLGLIEAAKRFDPDKGSYKTYAGKWIKAQIWSYIRDHQWGPVTQDHTTKVNRSAIEREKRKLIAQGIEPTEDLLVQTTHMTRDKIEEIAGIWDKSRCISIWAQTMPDDDDDPLDLAGRLSRDDDITMMEAVSKRTLRYQILRILQEVLDPVEEICLILLYGLEDNVPRTYETIGIELNYAKSGVHNICERAKKKLRQSSQKCNLQAFLQS